MPEVGKIIDVSGNAELFDPSLIEHHDGYRRPSIASCLIVASRKCWWKMQFRRAGVASQRRSSWAHLAVEGRPKGLIQQQPRLGSTASGA